MSLTSDEQQFFFQNKDKITSELLEVLRKDNKGKQQALDILDLPKDEDQYYLDYFGNRISFLGNRRLKKGFCTLPLSEIHLEEIEKCAKSVHYFKDNYVKIKTKSGINFPDFREYQNEFLTLISSDKDNIVALLPRQSGKSVSVGIYLAHSFIFSEDKNIGITANRGAQAQEFLTQVKNILIQLPVWLQQGIVTWNKKQIENEKQVRILTDVPSTDSFRGFTIHTLVCDEAAFIKSTQWQEFADAVFPTQSALSEKKNIIISTANGLNHFYDLVQGAKQGKNGFSLFELPYTKVPRYDVKGNVIPSEQFKEQIVAKYGIVYFNQNYGNEFQGSTKTLLPQDVLLALRPKECLEIKDGVLKIYERPQKSHKYLISLDPSKGGEDWFAGQIIDVTTDVFKQSAEIQTKINYLKMPEFIASYAEYYNNALVIIENNEGGGQSVADTLDKYYSTNLWFDENKKYAGVRQTQTLRPKILSIMKLFFENQKIIIYSEKLIQELKTFVLLNSKYQAQSGMHDDLVMALALCFTPFQGTTNFEDLNKILNLKPQKTDTEEELSILDLSFSDGIESIEDIEYGNVGYFNFRL